MARREPARRGSRGTRGDDGAARLEAAEKVRPQVDGAAESWTIAGVEFPDRAVAHVHPRWAAGAHGNTASGDGVEYDGAVDERLLSSASVEGGEVVDAGGDRTHRGRFG